MFMFGDPEGLSIEDPRVAPDYTNTPNPWGENGLIGMDKPYQGTIITGTKYGPVRVTIEEHDTAPPVELSDWTDVVEVGLEVVAGRVYFTNWDGAPFHNIDAEPGPYRLRAHARGRDEGDRRQYELTMDDAPVEEHLIQFFPGEGGEVVHKTQDNTGGYLRGDIVVDTRPPGREQRLQ